MKKILTVIGARPQFIKACVVSKAIHESSACEEILVHTGQHFDKNMSDVFFEQLKMPKPSYVMDINGSSHGDMTGRMLAEIEVILKKENPDRVLVYGDTNSTLAGALAAIKLHIPVAHVEAGLRSFNMKMPEEVNRILTDQVSDILYCPTDIAVENLKNEGFEHKPVRILQVGDVMLDCANFFRDKAEPPKGLPRSKKKFILATVHRAENTDDPQRLLSIVKALNQLHKDVAPVILPLHPRTRAAIATAGLTLDVSVIDPVGYLEMVWLLEHAGLVLTDSGGVQKEAFFFGKPCVTMRDQTEWLELVNLGVNELVGADSELIVSAVKSKFGSAIDVVPIYGNGDTAYKIVNSF